MTEKKDKPLSEGYPANTLQIFSELAQYMEKPQGITRMTMTASTVVGHIYPHDYADALDSFHDYVGQRFPSRTNPEAMKYAPQADLNSEVTHLLANRVVTLAVILYAVDVMMHDGSFSENMSITEVLDAVSRRYVDQASGGEEAESIEPLVGTIIDDEENYLRDRNRNFMATINEFFLAQYEAAKNAGETGNDKGQSQAIAQTAALITYLSLRRPGEEMFVPAKIRTPSPTLPPRRAQVTPERSGT